jgi:hypothetical protein
MSLFEKYQEQLKHPDNPVVFFDVTAGGTGIGRIVIELFADICPKTAENFRCAANSVANLAMALIFADNFARVNSDVMACRLDTRMHSFIASSRIL